MHVDIQCYEGRSLDTVTQVETLDPWGDAIARDYPSYTAATAVLETCDRLTEEREPALQQYLLLAGALRSLAGKEHDPNLVLDAYLLRALAVAGWAPSFHDCAKCGAPGPHRGFHVVAGGAVCPACRPPGSAAPAPETFAPAQRAARGRLGRRRRLRRPAPPRGQRPDRGVPAVAPRTRHPQPPYGGAVSAPSPYPPPFPHPSGARPPAIAARQDAAPRRRRHGRQRPLGQPARPAAHQGARGGRGRAARRRRRRDRGRRHPPVGLRVLDRELEAQPRRGASSSWASTATSSAAAATSCTSGACACAGSGAARGCGAR